MLGADYDSLDEFKDACLHDRKPLSSTELLGKIYSADQLRYFAENWDIDITNNDEETKHYGVKNRYDIAEKISSNLTSEDIGKNLSYLDHDLNFPILAYVKFPSSEHYSSIGDFVKWLINKRYDLNNNYLNLFNGINQPSGRNCELESININRDDNIVSLLFNCTRVLVKPEGNQANFEDYFLARIPVIVRVLFEHSLIEISMPTFSEPWALFSNSNIPTRYQFIVDSALTEYLNIVPFSFNSLNFKNFTLFLEKEFNAIDMGWKIEPQHEAAFDLTQGVISLRDILNNFSTSFKEECKSRGKDHPLSKIDLYQIFRALKEQSYTYSLVLQTPIGDRGGHFKVSVLNGLPNTHYLPIIIIPKNRKSVINCIRHSVNKSQTEKIDNPYVLDAIFS